MRFCAAPLVPRLSPVPLLPQAVRSAVPDRIRDDVRLRAAAVGTGLIPARTLHSKGEHDLLCSLAAEAGTIVEIGVYEGASAAAMCRVMAPRSVLHLIDPFGYQPTALKAGWAATEWASRAVVRRAARSRELDVRWHIGFSQEIGAEWSEPVDLVFIDGDHAEDPTRADWDLFSPHVRPGGHVLFHDARDGSPDGLGLPGPTAVVDRLFRGPDAIGGWKITHEVDRTVAVRRDA